MTRRRPLWPKPPPWFVQQNLLGHKILGLTLTALLYLVCLSGAVAVFYLDLQRWETASVPDVQLQPTGVAAALADARAIRAPGAKPAPLYVYLPTPENPRLSIQSGTHARAYDAAGRFVGSGDHPASQGLGELHYYLHLPSTFGAVIVGLTGLGMLGLIVGGVLAHPRLLKDAFLWRRGAGVRLSRTDLHNRIGVWALPFHIVIALTGAAIGLVSIVLFALALAFHHGDIAKASAPLFSQPAPAPPGVVDGAAVQRAFAAVAALHPDAHPSFLAVNDFGGRSESLEITADLPGRLVYGESFAFDAAGRLRSSGHLSDGPVGKEVYASLYKLHFGSFGGAWVRWAYVVLGLGLCLICTTGMDIWLLKSAQRGRPYPRLHSAWTGFVWGSAGALAIAAAATFAAPSAFKLTFWLVLAGATAASALSRDQRRVSLAGRAGLALSLLALVAAHLARFGADALSPAARWPNLCFVLIALGLAGRLVVLLRRPSTAASAEPALAR